MRRRNSLQEQPAQERRVQAERARTRSDEEMDRVHNKVEKVAKVEPRGPEHPQVASRFSSNVLEQIPGVPETALASSRSARARKEDYMEPHPDIHGRTVSDRDVDPHRHAAGVKEHGSPPYRQTMLPAAAVAPRDPASHQPLWTERTPPQRTQQQRAAPQVIQCQSLRDGNFVKTWEVRQEPEGRPEPVDQPMRAPPGGFGYGFAPPEREREPHLLRPSWQRRVRPSS
jgi:hypothetical protein